MIARFHPTARWRLRRGVGLGVVALLALLLSSPLAKQAPAAQAQGSRTFRDCTTAPTITIPAHAFAHLEVWGGAGSDGGWASAGRGGRGGYVRGVLPPAADARQLTIHVGCAGKVREGGKGYTSGGEGGHADSIFAGSGGGGGGGSAVVLTSGNVTIGPILVAGGGGGGGGVGAGFVDLGGTGGNAGATPQPGEGGHGPGGRPGGCAACVGGTTGGGGTHSTSLEDGGGGGGGGGAGNSYIYAASWLTNTSIGTSTLTGDGQVTVSISPSALGEASAQPMTITGEVYHILPPLVSENQIEQTLSPQVGAQVEALVGSSVCGTAVTDASGHFQLTVAVHPATPDCGQPGATVRFRVDGGEHPETLPFQSGGTATVALRSAAAPPPPALGWP